VEETIDGAPAGTVEVGKQHVLRVASESGFRTPKPIWDHPDNAELKQARVNPNTLAPGDRLIVPALEPLAVSKPTDAMHKFVLNVSPALLTLKLQDYDRQALGKRCYRLVTAQHDPTGHGVVPGTPIFGETTKDGEVSQEIQPFASEGEIVIHADEHPSSPVEVKFRLLIGYLHPASTVAGQQTRLNNLGYFAGFSEDDLPQLRWAIEEFQHDHGIKPTGKINDPKTYNKIAHEHGDLLPGEKVP